MEPAIFLDRDGTINEEMGYINHPDRFIIFPYIAESIKKFKKAGYRVVVITNQSGVARGYFTENLLKEIHQKLFDYLKSHNTELDALYYCPHHPLEGRDPFKKNCNCRKPKPGMIYKAQKDLGLDLKKSMVIGDRYKDIVFGKKLNMKTGMVLTGYGKGEYVYQSENWEYKPDVLAQNLLEIANIIV